jgi:carboxypeptidase Taq
MSDQSTNGKHPAYDELRRELRRTEVFGSVAALLSWDQETMMPPKGTPLRAEQAALLSEVVHERRTSRRIGDLLSECEADPGLRANPAEAANLREIRRGYDNAVLIPTALVREFAETTTHAQHAWKDARERSDFAAFAPWLEKLIGLTKAKAACLLRGDMTDPYDALLDDYEPGARTADIVAVFADLRARLAPLIREVAATGRKPSVRIHDLAVPIERQIAFSSMVAARVGFDFGAGRLDTSAHPFCQNVGPGDTRLTTRYREQGFFDGLSSTLHEAGHGLYEQNLPKAERLGEPLSEAVSLGIHESQSRLWENLVGRSRAFWEWALPEARTAFGSVLDGAGVDEVYGAMNVVEPGLIRVESDEATYNLHIMLRFDLERALLGGALAVHDLPGTWNERVRADLGIDVMTGAAVSRTSTGRWEQWATFPLTPSATSTRRSSGPRRWRRSRIWTRGSRAASSNRCSTGSSRRSIATGGSIPLPTSAFRLPAVRSARLLSCHTWRRKSAGCTGCKVCRGSADRGVAAAPRYDRSEGVRSEWFTFR